jgi:hypothetical protein
MRRNRPVDTRGKGPIQRQSLGSEPLEEEDGECVASGSYTDVWLFGNARKEHIALRSRTDETSRREAIQIGRYFSRFADSGPKSLGDKMFKSLGKFRDGAGNEPQIWEFKAYQFRIYGIIAEYRRKRAFLGTECDPSKKREKADQRILKSAAERSVKVRR